MIAAQQQQQQLEAMTPTGTVQLGAVMPEVEGVTGPAKLFSNYFLC